MAAQKIKDDLTNLLLNEEHFRYFCKLYYGQPQIAFFVPVIPTVKTRQDDYSPQEFTKDFWIDNKFGSAGENKKLSELFKKRIQISNLHKELSEHLSAPNSTNEYKQETINKYIFLCTTYAEYEQELKGIKTMVSVRCPLTDLKISDGVIVSNNDFIHIAPFLWYGINDGDYFSEYHISDSSTAKPLHTADFSKLSKTLRLDSLKANNTIFKEFANTFDYILPLNSPNLQNGARSAHSTDFELYMVRHNMFVLFIKITIETYSNIPNKQNHMQITNILTVLDMQIEAEQSYVFDRNLFKDTLMQLGINPHTHQLKTFIVEILFPMSEICMTLTNLKLKNKTELNLTDKKVIDQLLYLYRKVYELPVSDICNTFDAFTFVMKPNPKLRKAFLFLIESMLTYGMNQAVINYFKNERNLPDDLTDVNKKYLKAYFLIENASKIWDPTNFEIPDFSSYSRGLHLFCSSLFDPEIAKKLVGAQHGTVLKDAILKIHRKYSSLAMQMIGDIVNVYRISLPKEQTTTLVFWNLIQNMETPKKNVADHLIAALEQSFINVSLEVGNIPEALKMKLINDVKIYYEEENYRFKQ